MNIILLYEFVTSNYCFYKKYSTSNIYYIIFVIYAGHCITSKHYAKIVWQK